MATTAGDLDEFPERRGCCALDSGHDGVCAWICNECNGTQRCWLCKPTGDDLGNGCPECDGYGHCMHCHEGLVSDD